MHSGRVRPRRLRLEVDEQWVALEDFLVRKLGSFTYGTVRRIINGGLVTVNGVVRARKWRVRRGDEVCVDVPPHLLMVHVEAVDKPLRILWEDGMCVVVDKPAGWRVMPDKSSLDTRLLGAVMRLTGDRPFVVHRLDKDTSGVIVFGRNRAAASVLARQFENREVEKEYVAVVEGSPPSRGIIEAPIGYVAGEDPPFRVAKGGLPSVTAYEVEYEEGGVAWLRVRPLTGRTHQIRIHLAHIGCPILADPLYGGRKEVAGMVVQRLPLHAYRLSFRSPAGCPVDAIAPLPPDMVRLKEHLGGGG